VAVLMLLVNAKDYPTLDVKTPGVDVDSTADGMTQKSVDVLTSGCEEV
jgi:hypothetical protein